MASKKWNAEGAAVEVALTSINQGSSDPLQIGGTGTVRVTNTAGQVLHGTQSGRAVCTAGQSAYGYFAESGTVGEKGYNGRFNIPTAPSTDILIGTVQAASGVAWGIQLRTSGRIALINANAGTSIYVTPSGDAGTVSGSAAAPFPTGEFTVDGWVDLGTTGNLNVGDGECLLNIFKAGDTTPWQTSGTLTGQNFASKGVAITQERIGINTGAAATVYFDEFSVVDGRVLQGTAENPLDAPPVVTPPAEVQIPTGTKPTLTMTVTDPDGGTNTPSWAAVSAPVGATLPTVSYPTSDHKTMTTAANLTVPGEYTFRPTAGTVNGAVARVFVANADGTSVVMSTSGPMTGTVSALNNTSATDYMETTANPVGARQIHRMSPKLAGSAVRVTPGGYRNPADGQGVHVTVEVLAGPTDTVVKTYEYDAATADDDEPIDLLTGELAAFATAGGYNRWAVATEFDQLP